MQKTLTFILFILLAKSIFAQPTLEPGAPFMRYYTPKEYNGDSQVWCAVKDNRGIMYFGDNYGVLEFDGSNWKRIYTPSKTIVRSLAKDSTGRIYVGSVNEFGYLKPDKSGNLEYTSLAVLLPENERKFQDIHKIIIDFDKVYFFALNNIYIYSENKLKTIKAELYAAYACRLNNNIYVILKNKGICLLHDLILEPIKQLENSVENFTSIISFPDNKILISNGITNWRLYNLTTKQFEKFETPAQKYLDEHRLYFISRIDENKFAVVTKTGGLVILSKKGEIIQVLNEEKGLPAGRIYSVSTDNLGNLWLCMQRGICKIDINYPATIAGKLQNMNKYVLSACSYNGIRYIGTLDGIYYLPENTISKNYNPVYRKIESFDNSCWDITTMNNLLIAGGGNWLVVLKGSSKKILLYLNGLTSRCLTNSKNNPDILFFGVHNRLGYLRLNPKATFENVKILEEGYFPEIDDVVFSITEDNDGNLWVSTKNKGIYFIRFENSNVKNYKITHLSTNNGLPNVQKTKTFIIDSNIFVTTNNGIVQANLPNANESDSLISFTYTNYFGKEIKRQMQHIIKVDENNYLLKGETILNITKTPKEIVTDSIQFNRLISNFDELTPFLNDDKTISFGATEAFINYNPKSKRDFTKPFNVAIRKVTIDTDSVLFDGTFYRHSDSLRVPVLNQPLEEIPEIDFKLNSVTFQYSGLFYEDPQETQYSYKLVGYSKNWSEWSKENKAVFTNLKEGEYAFQVKARNVYLAESDLATYQFKIHHPWYLAWWAYLLYLLILTGFTLLVVKLSRRRLKKQNERLELTVSERKKEIHLQKEKIELQNKQLEKFNQERVKELQAFFALSKVVEDNNINTDKICQALLRILSQSFQFHDITTVRIAIFDRIYESKNFTDSKWRLSAPIKIGESVQGSIDVVYAEEKPKEFEGPFLKEERSLINAMAERLGDIIKRLQAEEKIRENTERLQNIFNNLQDAYFEADLDGKFTTISPSAIAIYGCSSLDELQVMRAQDLYADPQDRDRLLSILKEKKNVSDFVCLGKKKDNSTFWVSMSVQFKYDNEGKIAGTIGLVRDITERKSYEDELIKAKEKAEGSNRLKTAFINNISHEIRTPLNGILGFAPLAIESDISDEEKQKFLQILNFSGERLMNTVTDYMDISLIVSGEMPVNKKAIDIETLFNGLYNKFNEPYLEKNLQLKLQNTTNKVEFVLQTDAELLEKAISHLLYNSLKFTNEGEITLGYEIQANNLEIFVKDTGVGIAPESKERILEVFMQENVSNTRGHEGSGLGLSIANGLTKLLGGKIRIESEILKGTSVFISLPIEPNTTILDNELATNKNALKETAKILIAEDDDVSYLYLETLMNPLTVKIIRAINGKDVIEICQKNSDIDMILMDIQLPILNGYEATRQIRRFNKDVIIIAQTAYGLTGDKEKAIKAGCNDYISKPIKKKQLLALIQKFFEK